VYGDEAVLFLTSALETFLVPEAGIANTDTLVAVASNIILAVTAPGTDNAIVY